MVSTRSSNVRAPAVELAENGKSLKRVVKIKKGGIRGRPNKPKPVKSAAKKLKADIEKSIPKPATIETVTITKEKNVVPAKEKSIAPTPVNTTFKIVKPETRGRKRKITVPEVPKSAPSPPKSEITSTETKSKHHQEKESQSQPSPPPPQPQPKSKPIEETKPEPAQPKYLDILPLNRKDPRGRKRKQVIQIDHESSSKSTNTTITTPPLSPISTTITIPDESPISTPAPSSSATSSTTLPSKIKSTSTAPRTTAPRSKPRARHSTVTSIISQRIDENDFPTIGESGDSIPRVRKKYNIDRDNIKINKRIMSKDTHQVIKMFKKFDNEVLTNPEAKQLLLSLGFETRKRYITTFKHYMRFCCSKNLENFFVTGELMKQFYEEQFSKSSSNNPIIRLRKMDPAFSKLQEINYLVYKLPFKEIPNRQVAFNYLLVTESGFTNGDETKVESVSETPEANLESIQSKAPESQIHINVDSNSASSSIHPSPEMKPPKLSSANDKNGPRVIAYPHRVLEEEGFTPGHQQQQLQQPHHHHMQHIPPIAPQPPSQIQTTVLPPVTIPPTIQQQQVSIPVPVPVPVPVTPMMSVQQHSPLPPHHQPQPIQTSSQHQQQKSSKSSRSKSERRRTPFRKETIHRVKNQFTDTRAEILKHIADAAQNINQIPQLNMQDIANNYGFLYQQVNRSLEHYHGFLEQCFKLPSKSGFMPVEVYVPPHQQQIVQQAPLVQQQSPPPQQQAPAQGQAYQQPVRSPILDMNHDIFTVYEIVEEWYVVAPSIEYRLRNWGEYWIKDEIDHEAFLDRRSIVKFVDRLATEAKEDRFRMANLCDRYIHDKSILEEFITEIELDEDDLFKRVLRYRKRNT
ncbi:hypothetical protein DFJ63DRAFT_312920 [Scheffersomyces coipomensis]|uniref:uncharacterized protein n=1 Tax=Scheffersomyces coipomensis TaxID=1788519 RepID=UPI00315D2CC8